MEGRAKETTEQTLTRVAQGLALATQQQVAAIAGPATTAAAHGDVAVNQAEIRTEVRRPESILMN